MASMKYVGLDVHQESIAVAVADEAPTEVRFHGTIAATTRHSASWSADSGRLRRCDSRMKRVRADMASIGPSRLSARDVRSWRLR